MMKLDLGRLGNATNAYVVANTPLYLVRRLKEDSYVVEMAAHYPSRDIVQHLKDFATQVSRGDEDTVVAVMLLVSLAVKQDVQSLKEAASLPLDGVRWYRQVASILLQQTPSTNLVNLQLNQAFVPTLPASPVSSPTQRLKMEIGK